MQQGGVKWRASLKGCVVRAEHFQWTRVGSLCLGHTVVVRRLRVAPGLTLRKHALAADRNSPYRIRSPHGRAPFSTFR